MTEQIIQPCVSTYMRRCDIEAFKLAAKIYKVHILVRRTNPASLEYIGRSGYMPKPVDCKPKTADSNVFLPSGLIVRCAGLVVNPTFPGFQKAFQTTEKLNKAINEWKIFSDEHGMKDHDGGEHFKSGFSLYSGKSYLEGKSLDTKGQVFRRNRGGIYMVNPFNDDKHFGCLVFCPFNVQVDFSQDTAKAAIQDFLFRKGNNYLYGDYDLYGIIPAYSPKYKLVRHNILMGIDNYYGESFEKIRDFINRNIGVEMIQHGEQENLDHTDEALDIFWTTGEISSVLNKEQIKTIYERQFRGRSAGTESTRNNRLIF